MSVKPFPFFILAQHAEKPKLGAPCNNCGLCCRVSACRVSLDILHSSQTPCIALESHGGVFLCGMVTRPEHYLKASHLGQVDELRWRIKEMLGIGEGCGMDDDVRIARIEEL